jgi:hypothetical protein
MKKIKNLTWLSMNVRALALAKNPAINMFHIYIVIMQFCKLPQSGPKFERKRKALFPLKAFPISAEYLNSVTVPM